MMLVMRRPELVGPCCVRGMREREGRGKGEERCVSGRERARECFFGLATGAVDSGGYEGAREVQAKVCVCVCVCVWIGHLEG
jgi:hypothetical protein